VTNALDGLHCDHARDGTLRSNQMSCQTYLDALAETSEIRMFDLIESRQGPRTPEELAAFKAANLAAAPLRHNAQAAKVVKPSHRQEWQEFHQETLGMIEAAKRQGHFNLLPQLMQRLQNANTILSTIN
jgi:hypothetical protein